MSYDSSTDAVYGQLSDLITALQAVKAQADGVQAAATAIGMADTASHVGAASSAIVPLISDLQAVAAVLHDVKVST